MATRANRTGEVRTAEDYRSLPPGVRLDETIAAVDPDELPDPDAVHNVDQHRALRDD